ncbi:MAG: MobF family relaxase [Gaiellaceae bacterium]
MAKLTLGQEAYYEQQVAGGLDDYYAGRGESPGIWAGREAEGLGLLGVVGEGDLGTLLRGVNPMGDERLRSPVRGRTITLRTLDTETGEWREEQKRLAPVSGYDLVFSCPKSVSLLHALTDDERVRRELSEAHETAWQAALAYLEREACVVRRGHAGAVREQAQGFVAAAFRHRTSRAKDPHLHTHVIVANLARTADGEWRALDGEAILKSYRLAAGYLYEAQLRHEVTQRLGLRWNEPVKGMAELEAVPEEAVRAFSTRRQSLVEHMQARGTEGFAASRVAALATREAKEQVDLPRLREQWQARAAEHGLGRRELCSLVDLHHERSALLDRGQVTTPLFALDRLAEKQTTFTMPELVCAAAGSLRDGGTVEQVLETAEELARLPGIELLNPEQSPGRPARFTTRELLEVERAALELALAGRGTNAPCVDETILRRELMDADLTGEQRALVREASLLPDRVVCVVGVAGAGKTTALRVLNQAYQTAGLPVIGAAPSGRAADELAALTGIRSATLHRLLLDAAKEGGLPPRCVLVVDEAGMGDTRTLAPLLHMVHQAHGKAILVGDPHQLPAVGAGGLYAGLCGRLGALSLIENRRQRDGAERAALARLRAGEPEPYLAHAARLGRLHLEDDPLAVKRRLLEDWWQAAERDPTVAVMLAHRREDVRDLNQAAHARMLSAGRLGPDALKLAEREFRVGDLAICRRNDPKSAVQNGTRGTIVELDPSSLTLKTTAGSLRSIPLDYANHHLDHAYALTGHAAQGATVDRAFVLLQDEGHLREWGYVACSRARAETRLYLIAATHESELHGHEPHRRNTTQRVTRALSRSSAEPLAHDQRVGPSEAPARLFAQRQQRLDQARAQAQERLAAAEAKLETLGWRSHGRRGAELRSDIALHRAALRLADQRTTELRRAAPATPRARPPLDHDLAPSRTRSLSREREAPGLDLGR